jgi:monovalent cation/proton antiporter MnhG/PhaG subunit
MTAVVVALAGLGLLLSGVAVVGLLVMRDPYDRLHFVSLVTSVAAPLVVVALCISAGSPSEALKLAVIGAFLTLSAPVATTITARARWAPGGRGRK